MRQRCALRKLPLSAITGTTMTTAPLVVSQVPRLYRAPPKREEL
jgi:hypothetical protein